jgi:hypothetical protein
MAESWAKYTRFGSNSKSRSIHALLNGRGC